MRIVDAGYNKCSTPLFLKIETHGTLHFFLIFVLHSRKRAVYISCPGKKLLFPSTLTDENLRESDIQRRSKGGAGGAARPGPQVDGGPARGPRAYLKL